MTIPPAFSRSTLLIVTLVASELLGYVNSFANPPKLRVRDGPISSNQPLFAVASPEGAVPQSFVFKGHKTYAEVTCQALLTRRRTAMSFCVMVSVARLPIGEKQFNYSSRVVTQCTLWTC
jgi:hypothetical protein